MSSFPKKIVLTTEYGSSFFDNLCMSIPANGTNPYDIIENEFLIEACEKGLKWEEAKERLIASGVPARDLAEVDHWGWQRNGGLSVQVFQVSGPYIVQHYEGKEYVIEKDSTNWRD